MAGKLSSETTQGILALIKDKGRATVTEIQSKYNISKPTLYRLLDNWTNEGKVTKDGQYYVVKGEASPHKRTKSKTQPKTVEELVVEISNTIQFYCDEDNPYSKSRHIPLNEWYGLNFYNSYWQLMILAYVAQKGTAELEPFEFIELVEYVREHWKKSVAKINAIAQQMDEILDSSVWNDIEILKQIRIGALSNSSNTERSLLQVRLYMEEKLSEAELRRREILKGAKENGRKTPEIVYKGGKWNIVRE